MESGTKLTTKNDCRLQTAPHNAGNFLMSDVWYYAEGGKSVGPLRLSELKNILSGVSEAKNILVWRVSFSSWVRAEEVPELAAFVIKPPQLPIQPTSSLPPVLPRDRFKEIT
jgi:hypothetical protein